MDLKTLLGSAYQEGMTLADVDAALADRDLLDRSEAENLANNRAAATKRLLDAANKKLVEAQKKSTDTGTENAELLARIATLEAESKQAKRDSEIAKNTAAYVAMGYSEELAKSTAEAMADGDTAKINANLAAFVTQKTQSIRDELLKNTAPPAAGGNPTGAPVDYVKAKADALAAGDDATYMRLCREEMEQAAQK